MTDNNNLLQYEHDLKSSNGDDSPRYVTLSQEATYHKPSCGELCGICSCKSFGKILAMLIICFGCITGALMLHASVGLNLLSGWLVSAGVPFILFSIYASEIFGGRSIDKCQVFFGFSLHAVLFFILMEIVITYLRTPAAKLFYNVDEHNLYCKMQWYKSPGIPGIPNPLPLGKSVKGMNVTISRSSGYTPQELNLLTEKDKNTPCYGMGLALGLGGAVPEELMKFATFGAFISRGWIADPWAVVVYCFVIGSTFGFLENNFYVGTQFQTLDGKLVKPGIGLPVIQLLFMRVFVCQTILHGTTGILTGLLFAQRKFLYWRQQGELKTCCEFLGPRPFYIIMLPAMWFHFVNNMIAGSLPYNLALHPIWNLSYIANLIAQLVFAYYLFLTLKNVPRVNIIDLQKSNHLPKAFSYICCCGCCKSAMGERDRRYVSVLDMVNTTAGERKYAQSRFGEEYSPPIISAESV